MRNFLRPTGLAIVLVLGGCGGESITVGPPPSAAPAAPTPPPSGAPDAAPDGAPEAEAADDAPTALAYRDEDFVEAETNRDPFRAYTSLFAPRVAGPARVQREVVMSQTAVDELHLIAIVSGVANPSAMLVGHDGTGHTVHRGDYVGRAEVVQTGGEDSVPVTLNWRVERIRDDAVILSREDPTAPNRPPLTREIALHDPSEATTSPG
jgi:hypothetical protein